MVKYPSLVLQLATDLTLLNDGHTHIVMYCDNELVHVDIPNLKGRSNLTKKLINGAQFVTIIPLASAFFCTPII